MTPQEHRTQIAICRMPKNARELVTKAEETLGGEWDGKVYDYKNLAGDARTTDFEGMRMVGEALQLQRLKDAIGMEIVEAIVEELKAEEEERPNV